MEKDTSGFDSTLPLIDAYNLLQAHQIIAAQQRFY